MAPGYALLVGGGLLAVVASGVVAGIVVDDVRSMTPTYVVIGAIATWLTAIAVYAQPATHGGTRSCRERGRGAPRTLLAGRCQA